MASNPHDQLFRKTFGVPENAAGELQAVLPSAITSRIDWSTLRSEPGSFVDGAGRELHTDLLFFAKIDGREARIDVLFEHQSTVDRWMPLRVLVYMGRIWTRLREDGASMLPIILPVVVHHGETGGPPHEAFRSCSMPRGRCARPRGPSCRTSSSPSTTSRECPSRSCSSVG